MAPANALDSKRVLVLGAYGLIGAEIARHLIKKGGVCTGLVRSRRLAARLPPGVACVEADISKMTDPTDWRDLVRDHDAIVNASGALQNGLRDNLGALQDRAIRALIAACEETPPKAFVQISAPGADAAADTEFLRSKARADAALRASTLEWVILKPGLVIGPNAYGGTALIRMLAGFPGAQPLVLTEAKLQCVAVDDVCAAVIAALEGRAPMRKDFDLVEDEAHSLAEIARKFRAWMGFDANAPRVVLPDALGVFLARIGDGAGWLGWRPPLRSAAMRVLKKGVLGDPNPWREAMGQSLQSLDETLALYPATMQDRVFARAQLFFLMALAALSVFFVSSGVIGLLKLDAAARILDGAVSEPIANAMIIAGAVLDIGLGLAVLVRPWTVAAAWAMTALSLIYLAAGAFMAPALWLDPLGPMVKIIPAIVLAAGVALLAVRR